MLLIPSAVTDSLADLGLAAASIAGTVVLAIVVVKCIKLLTGHFIFSIGSGNKVGGGDGIF